MLAECRQDPLVWLKGEGDGLVEARIQRLGWVTEGELRMHKTKIRTRRMNEHCSAAALQREEGGHRMRMRFLPHRAGYKTTRDIRENEDAERWAVPSCRVRIRVS